MIRFLAAPELFIERFSYILFTGRKSRPFNICLNQPAEAGRLYLQFGKPCKVRRLAVNRGLIEFIVTRMDNCTHRRMDCKRYRIGDAMVHMDEFDPKDPARTVAPALTALHF